MDWLTEHFMQPVRLWLLLLVPILLALYLVLQQRKASYAVKFTNLALLDSVVPRQINWRQHLAVVLALVSFALAVVLFAQPAQYKKVPINVQQDATVVLTLDTSASMKATDVAPNRLAAAKKAALAFIQQLPPKYKVAVVSFARGATLSGPPTTDRTETERVIRSLRLGPYTATGEGLYSALSVIRQEFPRASADKPPRALVMLISDGARTVGRSETSAAEQAKVMGVKIYAVALGTNHGVIDVQGDRVPVKPDLDALTRVTRISGGKVFSATSVTDLKRAYGQAGRQMVYATKRVDATSDFIGYLLVAMLVSTCGSVFLASRWP